MTDELPSLEVKLSVALVTGVLTTLVQRGVISVDDATDVFEAALQGLEARYPNKEIEALRFYLEGVAAGLAAAAAPSGSRS